MAEMKFPKKVRLGDITVRDGFQHEEKFISTAAKIFYAEELILAGFKRIEVTNFGNPKGMPQFKDADELLKGIRYSKKLKKAGITQDDYEVTAITIREKAVDRAIEARKEGYGPDRILMMVSTDEEHHFANSGITLPEYWREAERCIKKAADAGIKMNGTVSTIWGSPISGPTDMKEAIEFSKRWLDIGAADIEHADHDGSAPPDQVYRYFSMLLDAIPNTDLHIAHFHVTRGWGLANVLAALNAGIDIYEATLGGLGGQPSNFMDDCPVPGTGSYYYRDPNYVGLVQMEDMVVMMDEMGIDTGVDVDRVLELGQLMERTCGRKLRSESILNGRIPKDPRPEYKRAGLTEMKVRNGEKPGQKFPEKEGVLV
ncbi:beta/alpha barrel domain-containing protein [Dethiobacter alkaliphilus]|uniref:pyruvate carboxyltransferase n=1 Tax=Dethiobacter alkaliphilus TaxID=427926 RepID=UPI0022277AB2|nr:pyruvate carboxyltransferase [Dethiobacter alkaliphilus]MCW3488778.1 pyruvate carboxyltransferase [Dethiobacter alkaliphilus]